MHDELLLYKDLTTGRGYVVAGRDRLGVTLRDLDSEPGDPAGLIVVSEWGLWQAVRTGRWERHVC